MLIPLRDSIPSRTPPYVSYAIIVACCAVHLLQYVSRGFLIEWALTPRTLVDPQAWHDPGLVHVLGTLFTSQFLHGDVIHLASNMLFLWVFGDNVEDRMGHVRFAAFYLLCGLGAGLAQSLLTWFPAAPMLGASGAIAGVLGAYFLLYRTAWIRSILLLVVFPIFLDIPALIFLGGWFILQSVNTLYTLGPVPPTGGPGVAFAAHAAGFVAGMALLRVFSPAARPRVRVVRPTED